MTDQIIPMGGTVEVSTDGSTFAELPEVKGMPVPATATEYPEVTSLDSPNGFREFIPGLKDGGEITFQMGYTSAGLTQVRALDGVLTTVRITMPLEPGQSTTGSTFVFTAYLTPALDAGDIGAPINMDVTCKISGDYTFTAGS